MEEFFPNMKAINKLDFLTYDSQKEIPYLEDGLFTTIEYFLNK